MKARFWRKRWEDGQLGLHRVELNARPPELSIRCANTPIELLPPSPRFIEGGLDASTEHALLSARTSAA